MRKVKKSVMVKAWIPTKLYEKLWQLVDEGEYEDLSSAIEQGIRNLVGRHEESK
jgi:Arc/MetJ-type ribon-helix-helix transcriptional regulator